MRHALRRRTRFIGSALLCAFVVVLSVTCFAQAQMTKAEMACCAAMAGGCGASIGQDHGCCKIEPPRFDQQLVAGFRIDPPAPQSMLIGLLVFAAPDAPLSSAIGFDHSGTSPPSARSVPAYLLLSTLRI